MQGSAFGARRLTASRNGPLPWRGRGTPSEPVIAVKDATDFRHIWRVVRMVVFCIVDRSTADWIKY
jgi:hypothetical protein